MGFVFNTVATRIMIQTNHELENTVLLASMGRSGSTFVSNVINNDNEFRVMFEPFYQQRVRQARNFPYPLYIRPADRDDSRLAAADRILRGRIRSRWVDKENRKLLARRRLIKDIRINLYLKWLHARFPGIRIVLLLRHPCAVAHSWLASGFGDGAHARRMLLSQSDFVADLGPGVAAEYKRIDTAFGRLVFFWCLYNSIPLRQFQEQDLRVVCYESFLVDPLQQAEQLFGYLNKRFSMDRIMTVLDTPSSTTRRESEVYKKNGDRITGWQQHVSPGQLEETKRILRLFNMQDFYCHQSSLPNPDIIQRYLNTESVDEHPGTKPEVTTDGSHHGPPRQTLNSGPL